MESIERSLAQHPFLEGLERKYLQALAGIASPRNFKALQLVFDEGDDANEFYLIESGRMAIEMHLVGVDSLQIQTIGPGEVLGWSWLLPPYHWHFAARAVEPTTAIALDGRKLRARCEENHDLGYEIMKRFALVVVHRLEATRRLILEGGPRAASPGTVPAHFPPRFPHGEE